MAKHGLGRGLESLIPLSLKNPEALNAEGGSNGGAGIAMLPLDKVMANPEQPRKAFEERALEELAGTIKKQGVLQPIIVEKSDDGNYIIIAGERRVRAARMAGLDEIPALVKRFTPEESLIVSLIENIQRAELNPIEEALAYKKLIEITGLTQDAAAEKLGKNRTTFTNTLRLLKLSDEMQDALREGIITAGHARALLSVEDGALRKQLFEELKEGSFSVRETERRALELNGRAAAAAAAAKEKFSTDEEEPPIEIEPSDGAGLSEGAPAQARAGAGLSGATGSLDGTAPSERFSLPPIAPFPDEADGSGDENDISAAAAAPAEIEITDIFQPQGKGGGGARSGSAPKKRDPELEAIETKFREALGTKVKLDGDFFGGTIKIDYYSMEDLDRLYEIIAATRGVAAHIAVPPYES